MKKYFAVILTFVLILTCFAACKPTLKDGALITNAAGENYAAVTEADGGIVRDEAGNLIVLVTDEDGRNIKGDNGEYQTNPIAIDHALVIGDTIEMPQYSIQIPDGWSDSLSFQDLCLSKDGTADKLVITVVEDESLANVAKERSSIISLTKSNYPDVVTENKTVSFGEITDALFYSAFVPDANGASVYLAFIIFEHAGDVYSCMINSNTDISASIPEITEILSTINFIH